MQAQNTSPDDAEHTLDIYGPPNTAALLALLGSWDADDGEEQHTTWVYLRRVLDEDRLGGRQHFPAAREVQGGESRAPGLLPSATVHLREREE